MYCKGTAGEKICCCEQMRWVEWGVNELMIRAVEGQLEDSYAGSEEPHGEGQAFFTLGKLSPFADLLISGLLCITLFVSLSWAASLIYGISSFLSLSCFRSSVALLLHVKLRHQLLLGSSWFLATISFHFVVPLRNGRGYLARWSNCSAWVTLELMPC